MVRMLSITFKKERYPIQGDITHGLEVFVDSSFTGILDKQDTQTGDRDTAMS